MKARRKAIESMPERDEQLTLFAGSVRDTPTPTPTPQRPLSEHERAVLIEWCGTDNHPFILEARDLFNATIVEIVRTADFSPVKRRG
jgi:hypothetical protein